MIDFDILLTLWSVPRKTYVYLKGEKMIPVILFILAGLCFGTKLFLPLWWKSSMKNGGKAIDKVIYAEGLSLANIPNLVGSWKFFLVIALVNSWWALFSESYAPLTTMPAWLVGRWLYNWWLDRD